MGKPTSKAVAVPQNAVAWKNPPKQLTWCWTRLKVCFNASFPIFWFHWNELGRRDSCWFEGFVWLLNAHQNCSLSVEQLSRLTLRLTIPTDYESLHIMEKQWLRLHKDEPQGCTKNGAVLWKHTSEVKTGFVPDVFSLHTDTTEERRMFSNSTVFSLNIWNWVKPGEMSSFWSIIFYLASSANPVNFWEKKQHSLPGES